MANCHKTLVKNRASFDSITVWSNIEWAKYRCAALMIVYHLAKVRAGVVYVFVCLHVFCAAVTIRIYRGKARAVKRTTTKPPIRHSDWILKLHCALNILITNYTRLWEKLIDLKRFSEIWLARNLFSEALQCRRWSENRGTRVFEFALGLLAGVCWTFYGSLLVVIGWWCGKRRLPFGKRAFESNKVISRHLKIFRHFSSLKQFGGFVGVIFFALHPTISPLLIRLTEIIPKMCSAVCHKLVWSIQK